MALRPAILEADGHSQEVDDNFVSCVIVNIESVRDEECKELDSRTSSCMIWPSSEDER